MWSGSDSEDPMGSVRDLQAEEHWWALQDKQHPQKKTKSNLPKSSICISSTF